MTVALPAGVAGIPVGIDVPTGSTFVEIGNGTLPVTVTNPGLNANSVGIRVKSGGSARILGAGTASRNTITGQHLGILVDGSTTNGSGIAAMAGDATALDNDTAGTANSGATGLLVRNGGIVDAGQIGASFTPPPNPNGYYGDITGLIRAPPGRRGAPNHSTGGSSSFGTGYTRAGTSAASNTDTGVPQAVRDLNAGTAPFARAGIELSNNYGGVGPQLGRMDVTAQNNTWGAASTLHQIEDLIYHDVDNSALGFVDYGTAGAPAPASWARR